MSTSRAIDNGNNEEKPLLPLFELSDLLRAQFLYPRFSPYTLGLFAQTSRKANAETFFLRLLSVALNAIPESYEQEDFTKLAAIAILNRYPELLFQRGVVIDHVGRRIKASPYQLFLGAGDVWAIKQVHEQIIPKIVNGQAQAEAQFRAQFPACTLPFTEDTPEAALYDDRNRKQIEDVTEQLKHIVAAITDDPCTNGVATLKRTRLAVHALRQLFVPKEEEVIATGLHFPLGIMREIARVYDAQFCFWSKAQLAFFSRAVIGSAEKTLTGVDGQCVKAGLRNLNMDKGPDRLDGLLCPDPKGVLQALLPFSDKFGRTLFIEPFGGTYCLPSSTSGYFVWYNKESRYPVHRCTTDDAIIYFGVHTSFERFIENKSRSYWEILCSHSSMHQPTITMSVTHRGNE